MKKYIVFDCFQTLLYKKNLEKIVQDFSRDVLRKEMPSKCIKQGYFVLYNRYKLRPQPNFETSKKRENFYIQYNKELFAILGITISSSQALRLNRDLKKAYWQCYPDVIKTLNLLQAKQIPVGIIANWSHNLEDVLLNAGLLLYFDSIYSSYNLRISKPNPKIFDAVLKKFDKIYYVGDDYELDVVSARGAGLIPVLIDRSNQYPEAADCIKIRKLTDLKEIIK